MLKAKRGTYHGNRQKSDAAANHQGPQKRKYAKTRKKKKKVLR